MTDLPQDIKTQCDLLQKITEDIVYEMKGTAGTDQPRTPRNDFLHDNFYTLIDVRLRRTINLLQNAQQPEDYEVVLRQVRALQNRIISGDYWKRRAADSNGSINENKYADLCAQLEPARKEAEKLEHMLSTYTKKD